MCSLPPPKQSEALQEGDPRTSYHLTVQSFLHGLQKPRTAPSKPDEVIQTVRLASIATKCHEVSRSVDRGANANPDPGPGLLDPPESNPSDEIDDDQEVPSPAPEARRVRVSSLEGSDPRCSMSMKMPKVIRTYTKKKIEHGSTARKKSTLFVTQDSTPEVVLCDGRSDSVDVPTEQPASMNNPKVRPTKKCMAAISQQRKGQTLQEEGEEGGEIRTPDKDGGVLVAAGKAYKEKRKKRRVPVNELPLVTRHSCHDAPAGEAQKAHDSNNAVDLLGEYFLREDPPSSTSPSLNRSRNPIRANVGKPITRIRGEIAIPQQKALAREKFNIFPITPRNRRHPGWKLGSGFDGIILESSRKTGSPSVRSQKAERGRTSRLPVSSLPKLELSARWSQSRHCPEARDISNTHNGQDSPVETRAFETVRKLGTADGPVNGGLVRRAPAETDKTATSVHVTSLTVLPREAVEDRQSKPPSSHYNDINEKLKQPHLSQSKNSDMGQAVREPSRSERNGWLKRKRYAVADEDEDEHFFLDIRATSVNAGGHGRIIERGRQGSCIAESTQTQRAAIADLYASIGGGQIRSNLEQSVSSQKHGKFQESSTEQHRHRDFKNTDRKGSGSEAEILDQQRSNGHPEPPLSSTSDSEYPSSAFHPKNVSMLKARPCVEVPRTSEIADTQEGLPEPVQIDPVRSEPLVSGRQHASHLSETTLNSGDYFSKAVRQLDSPEKMPHTVTRRKSRREPIEEVVERPQASSRVQMGTRRVGIVPSIGEQRIQGQEGSLQLGVTPRLKRRMSNVPFRPPFKEHL